MNNVDREKINKFIKGVSEKEGYLPFGKSAQIVQKITDGDLKEKMQIPFKSVLRAYLAAEAEMKMSSESIYTLQDLVPAVRRVPSIPHKVDFI